MSSLLESRVIESCSDDPSDLLALQLRIARRADELARTWRTPPNSVPDTQLWMEAEVDVLSAVLKRSDTVRPRPQSADACLAVTAA